MNGRSWTPEEDAVMRELYPDTPTATIAKRLRRSPSSVYARAGTLGLSKSDTYLASPHACRLRRGDGIGAHARFKPGHEPWNKGRSYAAGGRSPETRFKAGNRPQTWVPVGTLAEDADGYLKRKVRDDAPRGISRKNWVFVHRELWEKHQGPIPPGHSVVFRNGDKKDIRIENLELVTRAELLARNTIHNLLKPLAQAIQLKGAIKRKLRRIERERAGQ